ncbi:MAG TPA: T9SS type A sorting domain-containing protein [Chryseosolibacter sp.]
MIRWLFVLMWFMPPMVQAQFTYLLDERTPVFDADGNTLSLAWAGGLNATNVNTMDLNADGKDDLVLYDRTAGKVITFINDDNQYVAASQYENFFPADISNWLLLRDYNCDGRKDIFTGDILGIKVFTNVTAAGGPPEWKQYLFSTGFPGSKSPVLLTQGSSSKVNLQLQYDDLPSISDVDGDGELDIFNIQYAGHSVEFHQNLSFENGLPCDSLEFKRITRTWGNVTECDCGEFAFNGEGCPPAGGRTKHAGGKSLLILDLNADGAQDLLLAEAGCTQIYALPNLGTTFEPVIESASSFPQPQPVSMVVFPSPYFEDVDFDGTKDLIVTPDIFTKEYLNTNLQHSTWLYKNTGTNAQPSFSFVKRDFLQEDMIDVGDNAVPAFTDIDGDGDEDLVISSHSSEKYTSALHFFRNDGSASDPSFKLVTDDFLGFSSSTFYNVKIQFTDINSDQMTDLVFTATSFNDNLTSLFYFTNKSRTRLDLSEASLQRLDFNLTSSENIYVTDVNQDDLPDILVGRSEGNLEYWKNTGIKGSPLFQLEEENFLGFTAFPLRQNLSCAVADLDGDGNADLAIGDQAGRLGVISDFRNAVADQSQVEQAIIFNPLQQGYGDRNLGGRIWPTPVNLFNANKPALVVGNALGGIHVLRHDEGMSLPEEPQVNIFPNPVEKNNVLKIQADRQGTIQVFSMLGQQLTAPFSLKANEVFKYHLPTLAAGIYLIRFTTTKGWAAQRLVIR